MLVVETAGVICGVSGSVLGFATFVVANGRVLLLPSLLRLGASLTLGCVWH